ncbi:MAG: SCO1664 family protein [Chloroflexota bacterium]
MSDNDSNLPISSERVLEVLENGEIDTEYGMLRWSSNYAFLIDLVLDDVKLTAVYKPQRGERPLWDFPDGTLCYRETAAFLTSRELGWEIVPPTVLRVGSRGLGSIQFYVDHDPEINYFTFDENFAPQLMRISLFDTMINNADRKGGHCLLDSEGHLWGIDHGIAFNSVHKLRTVIWDYAGQPIPDDLMAAVACLYDALDNPETPYNQAMRKLLSAQEMRAFQSRLRHALKQKHFPVPGPGPNYPWPPV